MRKKAIVINAFNRPRHLYVVLESLRRNKRLAEWDVWVDFDGGSLADFSVCRKFDYHPVRRRRRLGCVDHPNELLRTALTNGYEHILYTEDDILYRSDTLDYMEHLIDTTPGCLVSLFHWPDDTESRCIYVSNSATLFHAKEARTIVKFMDDRAWIGLPNVLENDAPIKPDIKWHDIIWYAWARDRKVQSLFAPLQYGLNFGLCGMNFPYDGFDEVAFVGPPTGWLVRILKAVTLPEFAPANRTPGFSYA